MAIHSLGKISTASTTTGAQVSATHYNCQSFSVQAISTNTGVIYVCDTATPNLTTWVGVLWEIPAPSASTAIGSRPGVTFENNASPGCFDMQNIYILPSVGNEGARVTVVVS